MNRADLRWCRLPRSIPPVASGGISVGSASEEKPGGEVEGPEIDLHQGECERAGRFTFTDHTEDDHTNSHFSRKDKNFQRGARGWNIPRQESFELKHHIGHDPGALGSDGGGEL